MPFGSSIVSTTLASCCVVVLPQVCLNAWGATPPPNYIPYILALLYFIALCDIPLCSSIYFCLILISMMLGVTIYYVFHHYLVHGYFIAVRHFPRFYHLPLLNVRILYWFDCPICCILSTTAYQYILLFSFFFCLTLASLFGVIFPNVLLSTFSSCKRFVLNEPLSVISSYLTLCHRLVLYSNPYYIYFPFVLVAMFWMISPCDLHLHLLYICCAVNSMCSSVSIWCTWLI